MENTTAVCSFNMTAADLQKIMQPLASLCFEKNACALAVIGETTKSFEQILLERIGRYAGDGSYIEMIDDDGSVFRWVYANGEAHKVKPTLAWPELACEKKGDIYHG